MKPPFATEKEDRDLKRINKIWDLLCDLPHDIYSADEFIPVYQQLQDLFSGSTPELVRCDNDNCPNSHDNEGYPCLHGVIVE